MTFLGWGILVTTAEGGADSTYKPWIDFWGLGQTAVIAAFGFYSLFRFFSLAWW